jgi:hypothetical protein
LISNEERNFSWGIAGTRIQNLKGRKIAVQAVKNLKFHEFKQFCWLEQEKKSRETAANPVWLNWQSGPLIKNPMRSC